MCILCWNDKNNEKKWFKFESKAAALEYVKMYKINDYFIAYEEHIVERRNYEIDRLVNLLGTIHSMIGKSIEV